MGVVAVTAGAIVNIKEITMELTIGAHAQTRVEQSEIRHFFLDEALQITMP